MAAVAGVAALPLFRIELPARETCELPADPSEAARCVFTSCFAFVVVLFFENICARASTVARFFGTTASAMPASFIEGPDGFLTELALPEPDFADDPEPAEALAEGLAGL